MGGTIGLLRQVDAPEKPKQWIHSHRKLTAAAPLCDYQFQEQFQNTNMDIQKGLSPVIINVGHKSSVNRPRKGLRSAPVQPHTSTKNLFLSLYHLKTF